MDQDLTTEEIAIISMDDDAFEAHLAELHAEKRDAERAAAYQRLDAAELAEIEALIDAGILSR